MDSHLWCELFLRHRHHAIAVPDSETDGALRQVAELIGEVCIAAQHQGRVAVVPIRAEGHLCEQEVARLVHAELGDQLERVHHVAHAAYLTDGKSRRYRLCISVDSRARCSDHTLAIAMHTHNPPQSTIIELNFQDSRYEWNSLAIRVYHTKSRHLQKVAAKRHWGNDLYVSSRGGWQRTS